VKLILISQYPEAYREVDTGIRRALMQKFPYCVYYVVASNNITIFAILHARRVPDAWRQRFE
jgi:plasmid stabilization system protein ParE